MTVFVDQSGKVEDTARPTVLGLSNNIQYSVLIPAKVKREIQEIFRREGLTRFYIYILFSIGIYFVLDHIEKPAKVVIDLEYPGRDKLIKELIGVFLKVYRKPKHEISFEYIGSDPKVHYVAHDVFVKKVAPNKVITRNEVLKAIKKTDGHLRECLSTLVDARPRPYVYNLTGNIKKVKRKRRKQR